MPTPTSSAVEPHDQHALGGTDVEHDPPAGPVRGHLEVALVDAGRVRLGDRRRAGPGTASGRSCSAGRSRGACIVQSARDVASAQSSDRSRVRAAAGAGSASGRRARGARDAGRCASAAGRAPSARGWSTVGSRARLWHARSHWGRCPDRPTPDPVMLRATGLGRRFGSLWAVRGMDLEVRRGEVLGLLGPNGAGKTTTVRMLTALIEPTEGRASVDGFDVIERARGGPRPGRDPDRDARASTRSCRRRPTSTSSGGSTGSMRRRAPSGSSATCGSSRCGTGGDDVGRHVQQGHEAEAGDRPGAAPRAGRRLPRRADRGARPGGGVHRPRGHRGAAPVGPDDRPRARTTSTRPTGCATGSRSSAAACCGSTRRPGCAARSAVAASRSGLSTAGVRGAGRGGARRRRASTAVEAARSAAGRQPPRTRRAVTPAARPGPGRGRRRHPRGPRARDDPRAGLLRGHGRPARPRRGGLMRRSDRGDGPAPRVGRDASATGC